jgi:hypothetical protein
MGDTSNDPVDHSRTTRRHAGETIKNGVNAPGLLIVAVAGRLTHHSSADVQPPTS